jgi:anti-sigma-K factor RskA
VNVQEYISSGIVESYVLGMASAEEQAEFESMCRKYTEVLQARISFEEVIERQAMQNAVAPPPALKQQIMEAALHTEAKIISMDTGKAIVKTNWLRYAAAACAILLAGSLFWNISQYNRTNKLQASYDEVSKDYDSTVSRLTEIEDEVAMLRLNPNLKMAAMKGTQVSPASFTTVYLDTTTKDVYLIVNNLPKPASDKQYQLWALLNGNPIDLGMIDNDYFVDQKKLVLKMKNVSNAQAFAITLEKEGGNLTPQGDMYVLGNL